MADYHRDGYLEAVLFLFTKHDPRVGDMILTEHRPQAGGRVEVFIPNGHVDTKDVLPGQDLLLNALHREVAEEFAGRIRILTHAPLGTFVVEALKIRFHGFLIRGWEGTFPTHTVEEGKPFAALHWIPLRESTQAFSLPSALFFSEQARMHLAMHPQERS